MKFLLLTVCFSISFANSASTINKPHTDPYVVKENIKINKKIFKNNGVKLGQSNITSKVKLNIFPTEKTIDKNEKKLLSHKETGKEKSSDKIDRLIHKSFNIEHHSNLATNPLISFPTSADKSCRTKKNYEKKLDKKIKFCVIRI
jgi:hypothetical protein